MFNYFDSDEIERFKRKLFEACSVEEREICNQTMYKEFFGKLSAGLTREDKLREINEWSAAGQKAPVCAKKRAMDPNLNQKQGTLWIFGRRPDYLNQPVKEKRGVD